MKSRALFKGLMILSWLVGVAFSSIASGAQAQASQPAQNHQGQDQIQSLHGRLLSKNTGFRHVCAQLPAATPFA